MMRVSEKRAIAGQKGGIGSALARMKLENASRSRHGSSPAIAVQSPARAAANADHSHSHKSLPEGEANSADPPKQGSAARGQEPSIVVSPELAAYVARRTT